MESSFIIKKYESLPGYKTYPTIAKTLLAGENKMPVKPLAKTLIGLTMNSNVDTAHLILSTARLLAKRGNNLGVYEDEDKRDPFN